MSTAIPPNPNNIIRALLDIAQAAYVLAHSPSKEMFANLKNQLEPLEQLPQYCNNPVNGPCRASKYLESFLVGGSTLTTGSADVQRDGTEFKEHTWNAPLVPLFSTVNAARYERLRSMHWSEGGPYCVVDMKDVGLGVQTYTGDMLDEILDALPSADLAQPRKRQFDKPQVTVFQASAEFPTTGPIHHDFYTHRDSWRELIVRSREAVELDEDTGGRDADQTYIEHELRAFDRAFDMLPPMPASLKPQANAVSGQVERRLRPRLVQPIVPVLIGESMREQIKAAVEESRPVFESAMQERKHNVKRHESGLYFGMTEYRWEGWEAAIMVAVTMPNQVDIGCLQEAKTAMDAVSAALDQHTPGWRNLTMRGMDSAVQAIEQLATKAKNEIRTNMLANTADEALKIINDAGLLANLVELFKAEPFAEVSIREVKGGGWTLYVDPFDEDIKPRSYTSTSMHQAIVVAHKGERDLAQPEHEQCMFCGFTVETPCEAPPPAECPTAVAAQMKDQHDGIEQAVEMNKNMREYGTIDAPTPVKNRRELMASLLMEVKGTINVDTAKKIIKDAGKSAVMANIDDSEIEDVIRACEKELNK